ncbi:hypothetical protein EV697_101272 [Bisgaardia hudsonensis]|uniref:Uncharacterized protein n=1 Tax=Bisgaardia hudsonensis TaxID=109472 RepID=A0A4R2N2V2_9PAST|nr:hypothetical protein EV697_101272 [Bisgaardia hudsonensis]
MKLSTFSSELNKKKAHLLWGRCAKNVGVIIYCYFDVFMIIIIKLSVNI